MRRAGQREALESPHGMTDAQGNQWEVGCPGSGVEGAHDWRRASPEWPS